MYLSQTGFSIQSIVKSVVLEINTPLHLKALLYSV